MFDIKTLLIVITLVLISIIHYGFAPPREKTQNQIDCENLMADRWFASGDSPVCGKKNFLKSFKEYTFSMIHNTYNPPWNGNETHDEKQTRLLKRKLYTQYFLDLCVTYASVFSNEDGKSPNEWCTYTIKEEMNTPEEEQDEKISTCTNTVKNYFNIDDDQKPHEIFSTLYDDYTLGYLIHISERELPINYPLGFFRYYFDRIKFKYAKQRVHFKTIEDFCRNAGKDMVENKNTLQDTVPMP